MRAKHFRGLDVYQGAMSLVIQISALSKEFPAPGCELFFNIKSACISYTGVRLLALDPALRSSGYAVLDKQGQKVCSVAYGVIQTPATLSMPQCLVEIHRQVSELIDLHEPEACAVESVIFVQNSRTAVTLGAARGSAILAAAQRGLNIYEYPPKRVKQAVVGRGGAQKRQVGFMVRVLLGLAESPPADAADALAIGLTHLQMQDSAIRTTSYVRRL